jgi:hypothetical protein
MLAVVGAKERRVCRTKKERVSGIMRVGSISISKVCNNYDGSLRQAFAKIIQSNEKCVMRTLLHQTQCGWSDKDPSQRLSFFI